MRLEVHLLSHDDEQMLPWALRYWRLVADRVVVHDGGPLLLSSGLAAAHGAEARRWDTAGQLNDELARKLKNECWRGSDADFVAVLDADEFLWFPGRVQATLETYARMGAAVPRPRGFEMFSDAWFDPDENPGAQITSLVKYGAPDDKWYAKPVLFSPRLVADSGFGIGAHESRPTLKDGRRLLCDSKWPFADPRVDLLHFKSIFGGPERIAARYDATRERLSSVNKRMRWGNFASGAEHAAEKRNRLLPNVRRVIA